MAPSAMDNPVDEEQVEVEPPEAEASFFITAFFFQRLGHIFNLAGGLMAPLGRLWIYYFQQVAFGEQAVIMPPPAFTFIITTLLAFVEIKSQGEAGFPFRTHPQSIMFSVTSVLIYGLASAAEGVISAAGLNATSVYAIIACLGRIGSLCILVASLASLFYF